MPLIDPAHFPTIDTSKIEPAEHALTKWGEALLNDVEALRDEWRKLWGCYQSPEQGQVYALQDPAVERAKDVRADFIAAANALGAYASSLDAIKPDLDALRADAETFRAEALGGYQESYPPSAMAFGAGGIGESALEKAGVTQSRQVEWETHQPAVAKNNELVARLDEIVGRINQAEDECTQTLLGIAADNSGLTYLGADDVATGALTGAAGPGDGGPWGAASPQGPSTCAQSGYGLTTDSSGPAASHWGSDPSNAWGGQVNVLGAVAALSPSTVADVRDETDRHNTAASFLRGLVGMDGQADAEGSLGSAWDGWTATPQQGSGGAMMALNIASSLVPVLGVGQSGRGAATSRIARLAEAVALDTRISAALGGAARVLGGGVRAGDPIAPLETPLADMLQLRDAAPQHDVAGDQASVAVGDSAVGVAGGIA